MPERIPLEQPPRLKIDEIIKNCKDLKKIKFYSLFVNAYVDEPIIDEWVRMAGESNKILDIRFVTWEMIKNSGMWGNEGKFWKKTTIYYGWVDDYFYCVVKDQGKGFDLENPTYHYDISEGGGIICSRRKVDLIYNFKDNASYFCVKKPII